MKKILLCFMLIGILVFSFAACSDEAVDENQNGNGQNGGQQDEVEDEANYEFEHNGALITVNMEASEVLSKLGEERSYFEAPSCAFDGIDKIYSYGSFEVHTYPSGDTDYVSAIILKDDSVVTSEGVYIGDTKDKVLGTYGEDYQNMDGAFVYEQGEGKLQFIFVDDTVAAIEYIATESK
ncbi:hypothetical protein [Alkalibacter saccharofermentans]|uniref:Lipoprotein n=1 Tax=Alkalibacter saccharofermentans DSM 14828 TaxID=1120975 RepID=A0A1M4ZRS1_9FIRM|nr:hypothetical protein [Alkalibacter saccharofermentans]SHF20615.1 hypothetical protein SAMN02746064_02119 [Alkalibacter saccharofermentans DSM 14828]